MKGTDVRVAICGAALLLACGDATDRPGRAGPETGAPVSGDPAPCLTGAGFGEDGTLLALPASPGAARQIVGLQWQAQPGCEQLIIDLATLTGEAADAPGAVSAELLRELGIVRLTLPDVPRAVSDALDARFDGPLASAAYVVRQRTGGLQVDIHLGAAAEARVSGLSRPARLVVDLRPGSGSSPPLAARSRRIVVLRPRPGPAAYPLRVAGYGRTFEANVVLRVEHAGSDLLEQFTTASDYIDAWGEFEMVVESGPTGPIRLHIGEYSAEDGRWEGVSLDLVMEPVVR